MKVLAGLRQGELLGALHDETLRPPTPVDVAGLEIFGDVDGGEEDLEQLDLRGDPLRSSVRRSARGGARPPRRAACPIRRVCGCAPVRACSISTSRGSRISVSRRRAASCAASSCADSRNVMLSQPASETKPTSAPGFRGEHEPRPHRHAVHRPACPRPERHPGEAPLAHARAGPHPDVGRVEHHRRVVEADDHPAGAQRRRLQLHGVLVDQLDAGADGRRVAEVVDRDGRVGAGGGGRRSSRFAEFR